LRRSAGPELLALDVSSQAAGAPFETTDALGAEAKKRRTSPEAAQGEQDSNRPSFQLTLVAIDFLFYFSAGTTRYRGSVRLVVHSNCIAAKFKCLKKSSVL